MPQLIEVAVDPGCRRILMSMGDYSDPRGKNPKLEILVVAK